MGGGKCHLNAIWAEQLLNGELIYISRQRTRHNHQRTLSVIARLKVASLPLKSGGAPPHYVYVCTTCICARGVLCKAPSARTPKPTLFHPSLAPEIRARPKIRLLHRGALRD
jgi:hypothetical protein